MHSFKLDNIGKTAKQVGSKGGFKTILWLMAIVAVLFFGKKLFSFIKGIFDWGEKESEENLQIMAIGKKEFDDLSKKFDWSKTGVPMTTIETEVARAVQYMSGYQTDWTNLNKMVVGMTQVHFIGFFIKFGVRINDEFQNQAGDFIDWINFEKSNSPIALIIDPTTPIKSYLNKTVIPFISKFPALQSRLKKINS